MPRGIAFKMSLNSKREAALNEIRQNISARGFHTYFVTGNGYPHYAYTIGLSEQMGSELILAGCYYYEFDDIPRVLRNVVADSGETHFEAGHSTRTQTFGSFTLRTVHDSWSKRLLLGAFDYYNVEKVSALQIVPDGSHWTIDIPNLSETLNFQSAPAWRWLEEEWSFPIPKRSVAITNLAALHGEPITEVVRWEEDEWEMFSGSGPETTEDERRVVPIGVLLSADSALLSAIDLQVGDGIWRDFDSSEWHVWE